MDKVQILVVEDERIVALDIRSRLRAMGYAVVATVTSGESAIEKAVESHPDLVLMDIRLAGEMDGIEAAKEIRSHLDVPVVYLTAYADAPTLERAKVTEPYGYILKPFEERDLQSIIEMALHKHGMEKKLRESEERYALAVRGANDGLWDWDLRTNEMYFSPRWKSLLGYEEGDIACSPDEWFTQVHPDDLEQLRVEISAHLQGVSPHFEHEHRLIHRDGTYRWMLTRGLAVRDQEGRPYRMAGSTSDITERKRVEEQLLHHALHDVLTGLPNRALFMDRLWRAIARSRRDASHAFALLFLDFDHFKLVNDTLGHAVGDQLLVASTGRLQACLRPSDTLARLGGDEFALLVEDLADVSDATHVADRIQEALTSPFELNGHMVYNTASIGIVLSTTGHVRPEDALRDADIAMYRAKALGRACYEIFEPVMRARLLARVELETELRRAIERREFRLVYQPILELATGRIAGFEALVRWQHPRRGLMWPEDFVPVAEETGLIIPLGCWVLDEACREMHRWHHEFPTDPPWTISVNISRRQLAQPDVSERIEHALTSTGLHACALRLEVTESMILGDRESAQATLQQLRALGVQVHVDDFGTGYSSLSSLQDLPIDAIKIDRSFVSRTGYDSTGSEIVGSIVRLARNLDMTVVAEGVETAEQLSELRSLDCTFGQGYFLCRPIDGEEVTKLVSSAKEAGDRDVSAQRLGSAAFIRSQVALAKAMVPAG